MFRVAKLRPDAAVPRRAEPGSAGLDLVTVEDVVVPPRGQAVAPTGLAFELPADVYARIAPRSGLALKSRIHVMAGVVDSSYRGEVRVLLANLGDEEVRLAKGARVAQAVLERILLAEPVEVAPEELAGTERGAGGFGSTGVAGGGSNQEHEN